MALSEKLQLIIDADASGAIKGLDKTGQAADRNLGKMEGKLDKAGARMTSFGTAAVAAAGVAGAGLYKLAQSASDYGEQASAAAKVFGEDAAQAVEAFGAEAAKTAGISKTAAVTAANQFGKMGKAAGKTGEELGTFSTDLVQLAGDLASFNDVAPEQVIQDLSSALQGSAEPMRKYGVFLDDLSLRQEAQTQGIYDGNGALTAQQKILAANALILESTTDAQGDFVDTSDSLANQQRILAAELENTAAALGEGVLPVAQAALGTITDLASGFNELSEENQTMIGSLATWGVVGLGAVGTMSLIAGQAIKMRKAFIGADGGLTRMGKAARGAAGAFTVLVATDLAFDWANNITGAVGDVEEAITSLATNVDKGIGNVNEDFQSLIEAENDVIRLSNIWESFGRSFDLDADKMGQSIESVDRAFEGVLEQSGAAAQAVVEDFKRQADAAEEGSQAQKDYQELYERFKGRVDEKKEADVAATRAQADYNAEIAEAAGLTDDSAQSTEEATSALQEYSDQLSAMADPIFGAMDAMRDWNAAQQEVMEAQQKVNFLAALGATDTDEYREAVQELQEANWGAVDSAYGQEQAIAELAAAVQAGDVDMSTFTSTLDAWVAQGRITKEQADLVKLGMLGVGAEVARLDGSSATVGVFANDFDFWRKANAIANYKFPDKVVGIRGPGAPTVGQAFKQGQTLLGPGWSSPTKGGFLFGGGRATGGPIDEGVAYLVGEAGPELFVSEEGGRIYPNSALVGGGQESAGRYKAMQDFLDGTAMRVELLARMDPFADMEHTLTRMNAALEKTSDLLEQVAGRLARGASGSGSSNGRDDGSTYRGYSYTQDGGHLRITEPPDKAGVAGPATEGRSDSGRLINVAGLFSDDIAAYFDAATPGNITATEEDITKWFRASPYAAQFNLIEEVMTAKGDGTWTRYLSALRRLPPNERIWDVVAAAQDAMRFFAAISGRATGGPVTANTPYMVGEAGPELFMPSTSGAIRPNHELGGSTYVININGPVASASDAQRWILDGLRAAKRQGKTLVEV